MTNESLHKLIDIYTNKSIKERPKTLISKGLISKHIILVQIDCFDLQDEIKCKINLDNYYLIKNDFNQIVGVVYDMVGDLHWYIKPKFRKLGYLPNILKKELIPYLLTKKNKIYITISQQIEFYKQSLSVAKKVGFNLVRKSKKVYLGEITYTYVLTKNRFNLVER